MVVTHLTHGEPETNRQQAASLLSFVAAHEGDVTVVAGDLNAAEDSPQIRMLARQWVDAYRAAHAGDPGLTCCIDDLHAGPGEPLEKRIDYVFLAAGAGREVRVTGAWQVLDQPFWTAEGWQWASDHVGLVVALGLED
jgi:endonuclease/exonuclease/phosphatase family metal-dependent hydrolase